MKFFRISLYITIISFLLSSCGPKLNTVLATKNDLNDYKTFAYLPNSNYPTDEIRYESEFIEKALVEAVTENMKKQGYELDRNDPDLLVLIRKINDTGVVIDSDTIYSTYPYANNLPIHPAYESLYYYDYGTADLAVGYDLDLNLEKETTLSVDLIDRKNKKFVWRGTITEDFNKIDNTTALTRHIDKLFGLFGTDTLASY